MGWRRAARPIYQRHRRAEDGGDEQLREQKSFGLFLARGQTRQGQKYAIAAAGEKGTGQSNGKAKAGSGNEQNSGEAEEKQGAAGEGHGFFQEDCRQNIADNRPNEKDRKNIGQVFQCDRKGDDADAHRQQQPSAPGHWVAKNCEAAARHEGQDQK